MKTMQIIKTILLLSVLTLVFTQCKKDDPLPQEAKATTIELVSGGDQSAVVGTALKDPVVVMVKDQNGKAFTGTKLTFAVTAGSVSPATATTNAEGKANATWTLGRAEGEEVLTISGVGEPLKVKATAQKSTLAKGVYIVGYELNTDGQKIARLWKDGKIIPLNDSLNAYAYRMSVSNENLYIAGNGINEGREVIRLWKNDIPSDISNIETNSLARGLFTTGDDVYISGNNGPQNGGYFKNGEFVGLSSDTDSFVYSVFADGNDVYAAGYTRPSSYYQATIWKNGEVIFTIEDQNDTAINTVRVWDNIIYTTGYIKDPNTHKNLGCYWKNGLPNTLTDNRFNGNLTRLYAGSQGIYFTGYDGNVAAIWQMTNGVKVSTQLSDGIRPSVTTSIYVTTGGDVYISGYEENAQGITVAKFWKSGVATNLTNGTTEAKAYDIWVVE